MHLIVHFAWRGNGCMQHRSTGSGRCCVYKVRDWEVTGWENRGQGGLREQNGDEGSKRPRGGGIARPVAPTVGRLSVLKCKRLILQWAASFSRSGSSVTDDQCGP